MKIPLTKISKEIGMSTFQVLFELALMSQPYEQCWPECDDGFIETIRSRHRDLSKMGDANGEHVPESRSNLLKVESLPISFGAAAILHKLWLKQYGCRPIQVFTLTKKWVHNATEEDIEQLISRGNLEWLDDRRTTVRLNHRTLQDTLHIVELYRINKQQSENALK